MRGAIVASAVGCLSALVGLAETSVPARAVVIEGDCLWRGAVVAPIAQIFARHPGGGGAMSEAVSRQVVLDASQCADVIVAARGATSAVVSAAGDGLAGAYLALSRVDAVAAARISACVRCADPELQVAFNYNRTVRSAQTPFGQGLSSGSGGWVVSPSRP